MQYPLPAPPPGYVTGDESSQLTGTLPNFHGAACSGADQRLFFPRQGNGAVAAVAAAKRLCAGCQILTSCREWAVAQGRDTQGVWGGTTDKERRAIRAGRRELVAA